MLVEVIILIFLLFLCGYLPAYELFHDHNTCITIAHVAMYTSIGLASFGLFIILTRMSGLDIKFALIPGILLSIYALFRSGWNCLPKKPLLKFPHLSLWFMTGISMVYFCHIFFPGILMGRGTYPPVFFNVDSAYYLGQIHALIRFDSWPPESLSFLHERYGHHYGAQSVCTGLSLLTGLPPHTSAFLVYMPLITLGILAVSWLIVQEYQPERQLFTIGVLLILFCTFYPVWEWFNILYYSLFNIRALGNFRDMFLDAEVFGHGYPLLSSHFGTFAALVVIYCLQNIHASSRQKLAVFILAILMLFKSPYVIPLGVGFGLWILVKILRTGVLRLAFLPLFAFVLDVTFHFISKPSQRFSLIFLPWQFFKDPEQFGEVLGIMLIYSIPLFYGIWREKLRFIQIKPAWSCWFFILPALVFVNIFGVLRYHYVVSFDLFQVLHVLPLFWGFFIFTGIQSIWQKISIQTRKFVFIGVLSVSIIPLSHKVFHTVLPLVAPQYGHEFVDNRRLGNALCHIPVHNSVIVTNDFRYPAQNYRRNLQQMQFPALFGHQTYAINFTYERYQESDQRLVLQQRFRQPEWDQELETLAQQLGWTHLVIHRPSPHPAQIPLPLLFENEEYQVYIFNHRYSFIPIIQRNTSLDSERRMDS